MTHRYRIEAEWGERLEDLIRRLYETEGRTQDEIAQMLRVSRSSVSRWLRAAGIAIRKPPWRP